MNNIKLKPCPFCGSEVKIVTVKEDARTVGYSFMCVHDCSNTYLNYADREEAIEAWNKRNSDEKQLPKEPIYKGEYILCPSCRSVVVNDYCCSCGQKIDWN